jgi:hypothetical protein
MRSQSKQAMRIIGANNALGLSLSDEHPNSDDAPKTILHMSDTLSMVHTRKRY